MLTFVIFQVGRQFVFLLEQTHPYSKLGVFHKGSLLSELCYTEKVIYSWGLAQHAFPGGQSTLPFFIRKFVPCVPLPCQLQVRILAFTRPVCSLGNLGYRGVTLKGVMEQMANLKTFCKCSGVFKKILFLNLHHVKFAILKCAQTVKPNTGPTSWIFKVLKCRYQPLFCSFKKVLLTYENNQVSSF